MNQSAYAARVGTLAGRLNQPSAIGSPGRRKQSQCRARVAKRDKLLKRPPPTNYFPRTRQPELHTVGAGYTINTWAQLSGQYLRWGDQSSPRIQGQSSNIASPLSLKKKKKSHSKPTINHHSWLTPNPLIALRLRLDLNELPNKETRS